MSLARYLREYERLTNKQETGLRVTHLTLVLLTLEEIENVSFLFQLWHTGKGHTRKCF